MNNQKNLAPIQEVYLQGRNSHKEVVIDIGVISVLVDAYMTKIPNEHRTTKMSLNVLRLHEDITGILLAEASAVAEEANKRTIGAYQKEEV